MNEGHKSSSVLLVAGTIVGGCGRILLPGGGFEWSLLGGWMMGVGGVEDGILFGWWWVVTVIPSPVLA